MARPTTSAADAGPDGWRGDGGLLRIVVAGALLFFALYAAGIIIRPGELFLRVQSSVIYNVPALAGLALAVRAIRHSSGRERVGWACLAIVLAVWGVAEWSYAYYDFVLGAEVPFPGWPDAFYYAGYLAYIPAIPLLTFPEKRLKDRRWVIDVATVMVVCGTVIWHYVVHPVAAAEGYSSFSAMVALGYLLLDFGLLTALVVTLYASGGHFSLRSRVLLMATLALVLADSAYTYAVNTTGYDMSGSPMDLGWVANYLLIAVAFVLPPEEEKEVTPSKQSLAGLAIPYFGVAPLAAVVLMEEARTGNFTAVLLGAALAVGLVIIRQLLTLADNLALYRRLEEQSQSRLALLEAQSELGEIFIALEGRRITYANGAACQVSGYTAEELHALDSVVSLVAPDVRDTFRESARAILNDSLLVRSFETVIARKDGERVHVEVTVKAIPSVGVRRLVVIGRDVTERKRTEQALARQTALVRLVQEASLAANEAASVEEAFQMTIDLVCAHTGWPVGHVYVPAEDGTGELAPTDIWRLDDPDRFAAFRQATEATRLASGIVLPGRVHATRKPAWIVDIAKDGNFPRARHASDIGVRGAFAFPVLVGTEVAAVLEFFMPEPAEPDIDLLESVAHIGRQIGRVVERERARETIRRSEERYRDLFENANDIVYTHDLSGRFTSVNKAGLQATGYTLEEALQENMAHILSPEHFEQAREMVLRKLRGEPTTAHELEILTKDGRRIPVEVRTRLLYENGRPIGVQGIARDITERKEAEEALRHANERLRALVESSPLAVISLDLDLIVQSWNSAAETMFGWTAGEIVGHPYPLVPPDRQEEFQSLFSKVVHGEAISAFETKRARKDGSVTDVSIAVAPLRDRNEEVTGIITVIADVTARKQAENALRESEERLRSVVANAPVMLFAIDSQGVFTLAEGKGMAGVGLAPRDLVGRSAFHLFRAFPDVTANIPRALAGETFDAIVDAGNVVFDVHYGPVRDASGAVAGVIGVAVDITERRRAEETRARLATILEATPDFVGTIDAEGRVLYLNSAGRAMLGIGPDQDISQQDGLSIHPDWARVLLEKEGIPAASRDGVWHGETAIVSPEGGEIPVSQVIVAHKQTDGSVSFLSTIARDISERKLFEDQLIHAASHDPLTGVFNRRRLEEDLEREMAHLRRYGGSGALMFLDLDDFKAVNDSLGHRVGDEMLTSVAQVLRERLRETDVLARLGGDEFAILMTRATAREAKTAARGILQTLRQHTVLVEGRPLSTTASIGIALMPEHGQTVDELLAHADLAMYEAKEHGRNSVVVYDPKRNRQSMTESRLDWKRRIAEALERDLFHLYCQPIFDLKSGTVAKYELLLRMPGENGEVILPGAFLDTAERFGLIQDIDRWVVRQAISLIAEQRRIGRDLRVAVNVSGKAIADAELLRMIRRDLAASGVNPASLTLEITESVAIADMTQAQKFVNSLKSTGCQFALDDFGVGFSSFYHLKSLPVDELKIDGSFIRYLTRDPVDQHLVKAIVEVAEGLGRATIAEFVGDDDTVRLLKDLGVGFGQGFHLGRPVPVATVLDDAGQATGRAA